MKPIPPRTIFAFILVMSVLLAFAGCTRPQGYPAPPVSGSYVTIDIGNLPNEEPRFYIQRFGERTVTFFVLRLNGKVLSFLDACVTCYAKKKGYLHNDGLVICKACGQRFGIYTLEKGLGNCYPIKLPGKIEDGFYRIALADLERETGKF